MNDKDLLSATTRRRFLKSAGVGGLSVMTGLLTKDWLAGASIISTQPLNGPLGRTGLPDVKGSTPWAVILCQFNDLPALTIPRSDFTDFVAGPGKGGVFDYYKDISYGAIDLTGSRVFGWWTMKYSFFNDGAKPAGRCPNEKARCAWITEAIRLANENHESLSPFYGVIAVVNANIDDSNFGRHLSLGIRANWGQDNWRWCKKCMVLAYAGNPLAACPAGDLHDLKGSWNYVLANDMPTFPGQNNWKWCRRCQALAYAGFGAGVCSAGGVHDQSRSADYRIALGKVGFPGQPNWKWCKRCQVLSYAGSTPGVCAAGGKHDYSSSGDYTLVAPVMNYESHLNVSFAAHEMGHGYGLHHAQCAGNAAEYCCPWDIMGTGVAAYTPKSDGSLMYVTSANRYAPLGPGPCAPNLQRLGWLPNDRIKVVMLGIPGMPALPGGTITLAALNRPDVKGYLMVHITTPGRVITVEFRQRTKWDRGLPGDAVIVHEIRAGGEPFLLGDYGAGQQWADFERSITVVINSIDTASATAKVTI